MVNAGLIKITIVDDYLAEFWKQVLTNLTVHDTVAVRTGGNLAVAIRKDSPQLAAGLNAIIAKYGLGTAFGNMMQKRYLQSTKYVKDATSEAQRKKFLADGGAVQEVQRPVRHGLPADGRAGVPGVRARPVGQEPGRRGRRDAGDAGHRARN